MRRHPRFFLFATFGAIALRLLFILRFSAVTVDSFIYGDIAKTWLQHGIYGLGGGNAISPTSLRLPGYPAFLAVVFSIFGMEHYRAVLVLQMLVDIGTCFLIADMARRLISPRAAKAAFLLAAICPFLANYAAAVLTETWEIFFTTLALDLAIAELSWIESARLRTWLWCGLAIAAAILLRPDGGLLLAAVEFYLFAQVLRELMRPKGTGVSTRIRQFLKPALVVGMAALAPLVPWTLRNLHTLHEFQPLAPRYANEENAFVPTGFNRWMGTWIVDYASVEEVYWAVPGSAIDGSKLADRAFDSAEQRDKTEKLLDDYNRSLHVTPDLDARFAALAAERIHRAPLRYYIWLPMLRISDIWLRPRTELLPCDTRWWEFDDEPQWLALAIALGLTGLFYLGAALLGLLRRQFAPHLGLLITFVILRSAFLGTLENPEPRYTLECYPVVIVLAAALWQQQACEHA